MTPKRIKPGVDEVKWLRFSQLGYETDLSIAREVLGYYVNSSRYQLLYIISAMICVHYVV